MEGEDIGMGEETDSIYRQTDDIVNGVLKRFNATQVDISSLIEQYMQYDGGYTKKKRVLPREILDVGK